MNKFIGNDHCFVYNGEFFETMISFDCDNSSKSILIYTDNTYDKDGKICVYASYYSVTDNGQLILDEIDSDYDYDTVIAVLDKVTESVQQGIDTDDIPAIVTEYINNTTKEE